MKYRFELWFTESRGRATKWVRGTQDELQAEIDWLAANGCSDFQLKSVETL